jgi:hypothetical protein
MTTVYDLWRTAYDLYARARSSLDPTTKTNLLRTADDYLKQANEIRRSEMTKAEWPKSDRKLGPASVRPAPHELSGGSVADAVELALCGLVQNEAVEEIE